MQHAAFLILVGLDVHVMNNLHMQIFTYLKIKTYGLNSRVQSLRLSYFLKILKLSKWTTLQSISMYLN